MAIGINGLLVTTSNDRDGGVGHGNQPARAYTVGRMRRGSGSSSHAVDAMARGDLLAYFASVPVNVLRSCWVACVVDEMAMVRHAGQRMELGEITLALVAVAERLHGVEFKEVVMAESPQGTRATPIGPDGVAELAIQTGDAPPERRGAVRNPEILRQIQRLDQAGVGAWVIIPDSIAKLKNVAMTLRGLHRRGLFKQVRAYRDSLGRTIVKKHQS